VGCGASNSAAARLILARGADPARCLMVDSRGILGKHRSDIEGARERYDIKWQFCLKTNSAGLQGGIEAALKGADVVIAASKPGPGVILPEWIRTMNQDAIVFACSNPVPEIWPWEAKDAGAAIVATGRSDFPNQVNNSLGFPGIFRGTLDVRAKTITDEMCFAAADALAEKVGDQLSADHLLPTMDDWTVFPHEAAAVGMCAQKQGVALKTMTHAELYQNAERMIKRSRHLTQMMMDQGFIPMPE